VTLIPSLRPDGQSRTGHLLVMRGQKAEYGDTADHKAGRLAGHQTAGYNTSYW